MMFSATHACEKCRLRFSRRAGCPSCGGDEAPAAEVGSEAGLVQRLLDWIRSLFGVRLLPPARMRVFSPTEADAGATTLTGVARLASVEIESVLSGAPCLLFGLEGTVGDFDVADADGGDFDLELPSGERVMISLEHAMLVVDTPAPASEIEIEIGSPLANLLEARGIPGEGTAVLEEHLVRAGDQVTVVGEPLEGTVTSFGHGSAGKMRVLAGSEDRPLSVRVRRSP